MLIAVVPLATTRPLSRHRTEEYEGDFVADSRTGYGVFQWTSGNRYEGQFLRDKRTGTGSFLPIC